MFGRVLPLILAQRVGPLNVLICAACLSAIMMFCWTKAHNSVGVLVFNAFFGVGSGMSRPVILWWTAVDGLGAYAATVNPSAASFAPVPDQVG